MNSKLPNVRICNIIPVFITDNDPILTLGLTWQGYLESANYHKSWILKNSILLKQDVPCENLSESIHVNIQEYRKLKIGKTWIRSIPNHL